MIPLDKDVKVLVQKPHAQQQLDSLLADDGINVGMDFETHTVILELENQNGDTSILTLTPNAAFSIGGKLIQAAGIMKFAAELNLTLDHQPEGENHE